MKYPPLEEPCYRAGDELVVLYDLIQARNSRKGRW